MPDRRLSAVEKNISDVRQTDIKVALTGTVIAAENGQVMLDDGTGHIMFAAEGALVGDIVRVFGRIIPKESEENETSVEDFYFQAEIIQNLQKIDLNLFRKVSDMWREANGFI